MEVPGGSRSMAIGMVDGTERSYSATDSSMTPTGLSPISCSDLGLGAEARPTIWCCVVK